MRGQLQRRSERLQPVGRRTARDGGFILVTVLWLVGLIALIVGIYSLAVRTDVRLAADAVARARAEALADAGAELALRALVIHRQAPERSARFPIGTITGCEVPGAGQIALLVTDEGGRIDLNAAGMPLYQALFAGRGVAIDQAAAIAAAILDYRDGDDAVTLRGAERDAYRAAGRGDGPKNAPFATVGELGQVLGVSADLVARVAPHLTVATRQAGIDPAVADAALVDLIARGLAPPAGGTALATRVGRQELPALITATSARRFYRIRSVAYSAGHAVFVRESVVDLGEEPTAPPVRLSWSRGELGEGERRAPAVGGEC